MRYFENRVEDVKIAYIGGGSKGWAWGLMSDLAVCKDMSGNVALYDIDYEAAKANEIIGNKFNQLEETNSTWNYKAVQTIGEALTGADAVVISIMPGTLKEMGSDIHTPEKYGIYQSVGDTTGPGGIIRAMRTLPMIEEIARNIEKYCPDAWVINYTNPMTLCVKALYYTFPKIKAFGCCHEVFGTQNFLKIMVKEDFGEEVDRSEMKVNPVGVNHFTWLTEAHYKNKDLFPYYREFCKKYVDGYDNGRVDSNWMNNSWKSEERVKIDLFLHFGYIAAAGDRHLAEFCPGEWYLESPEKVTSWKFGLTTVETRIKQLNDRLEKSAALVSGKERVKIAVTGEEGVEQLRALFGLRELVTNVNLPNQGQIPNLPIGAVVETNAVFRANHLQPVCAGSVPEEIYPLVVKICAEQELVAEGIKERNTEKIFEAFANNSLITCNVEDARRLFEEMCNNTKDYLNMYDL